MFEQLQKFAMKKVLKRAAIAGVILVVLLIVSSASFLKLVQGPEDLYSLSANELLGAYVEADVYAILDKFASYTQKNDSGKKTQEKAYYIIPINDYSYIALEVDSKNFYKADQICDETYEYIIDERSELTTSMHVKGSIRKMDGKISDFYYEWFEENGFYEEDINTFALGYVLDPDYVGSLEESMLYMAIFAAGLLLTYLVFILIKGFSKGYLASIKSFIKKNQDSLSQEDVEADFERSEAIESVRVGRKFTFYFKGPKCAIVKNDDIIWAYLRRTTHRTNGIKTHVTKSLILNTRNKKTYTVDMRTEEGVTVVLQLYAENNPHIVLGYSDELMKCYRKDMDAFLRLSMSQVQTAASSDAPSQTPNE
jgi:hypothetical protein